MRTTVYDPYKPEHKATCQRTKCADLPAHPGGRHLDQRDELYDGPGGALGVASIYVRDSARKIVREAPGLMPEVMDLINGISWLQDQVTHAHVDRDRGIREASARALDCEAHGEVIRGLEDQVHHFDESYRRADAGRVALLGLLHAVDELVRARKEGRLTNLTLDELVKALAESAKKTSAAHERAWKR
jgi:hypothetical protein